LPVVDFLARRIHRRKSGELVDLILLLWLYSNPHETRRRTLSSLRHILKHTPDFQRPDGRPKVTEEELNQIVLAALHRLKEKGYATIHALDEMEAQISLTEKGITFVRTELTEEALQFLDEYGHAP